MMILIKELTFSDELLKACEWAELRCGGGVAKLTLPCLNKEDEGLYTLRMWTKEGTTEHSAYLFVKGKFANLVLEDPRASLQHPAIWPPKDRTGKH